jgi:Zn ribbon nucleic-acid-binding protein
MNGIFKILSVGSVNCIACGHLERKTFCPFSIKGNLREGK